MSTNAPEENLIVLIDSPEKSGQEKMVDSPNSPWVDVQAVLVENENHPVSTEDHESDNHRVSTKSNISENTMAMTHIPLFKRQVGAQRLLNFRHPSVEFLNEAQTNLANLKTAMDGKMEVAIMGVLSSIISSVTGNSERQRAYYKADVCPALIQLLMETIHSVNVCQRTLQTMAVLCRHSDESKSSFSLEIAKGLGIGGACEATFIALQKHPQEPRVFEAASDFVRCMCVLDSNRDRLTASGVCEAIGRALGMAKFSSNADLCCWLCRAIGHLAYNNPVNKEKLGKVGVCESAVLALQTHSANMNVCTEVAWTLRNLSQWESNNNRISDEFGPESLISVLKTFVGFEVFVMEVSKALVSFLLTPKTTLGPDGEPEEDDLVPRIVHSGVIPLVLKAIKKNPSSDSLAQHVFHLLYFISCEVRLCQRLISADILDIISTSLEQHAHNEGLSEWACRTVHNLSRLENTSAKMRNAGLCEMIVSCVQRQAISETVSGIGCLAIGDLAMDMNNQSRLSQSGACEAVVGALKRHDSSADVVSQTCHAIHYLAGTENNVGWMGANGGCEAVTTALKKHSPTSATATQSALRAIGSLAFGDEGNLLRLHAAGACVAVVQALRTYGANDAVAAEYACRAIYNLCAENSNVSELGAKGACGLVVGVLQTHDKDAEVITQAFLAIFGLAVKMKTDKVHNGNTRKLVTKGAIECVVAAMKRFPADAELQRSGAMTMAALASLDQNREKLGSAGAVDIVLASLTAHTGNERVVSKMAYVTDALCRNNDKNKQAFAAGGIVDILLRGLYKHERVAAVVNEILRAFVTLMTHAPSKAKIREESPIKQYVQTIKYHEKDAAVARWGCTLIYTLATDDQTREKLREAKACEVVILVLHKHVSSHAALAHWGCRAIVALSAYSPNKVKFNNTETCSSVVAALKQHGVNGDVAEWSLAAMVALAQQQEQNRQKLGGAGACNAIFSALTKLAPESNTDIITRLACEAIYELALDPASRHLFGIIGMCEVLTAALATYSSNHVVSQQICRAIAGLSRFSETTNENSTKFGVAGTCELVVHVLKNHSFNSAVVEMACSAIASLTEKNPHNKATFGTFLISSVSQKGETESGAPQQETRGEGVLLPPPVVVEATPTPAPDVTVFMLIVGVLTSHRSNVALCLQATRAARNLVAECPADVPNAAQFSSANLVAMLIKILKTHASVEGVVENCLWLLSNVVNDPLGPSSPDAAAAGGFATSPVDIYKSSIVWDLITSLLQTHGKRDSIVKWGCAALSTFASRGGMAHVPACDAVMVALMKYFEVKDGAIVGVLPIKESAHSVLERILICLGALATAHMDNVNRLVRHRACECLSTFLSSAGVEGEMFSHGLFRAVEGLAAGNDIVKSKFNGLPNFCMNLVRLLYNELDTEAVAISGSAALSALVWKHPGNQAKLSHACNFMADIFQDHKNSSTVVLEALKAVSRLCHANIANRNKLGSADVCKYGARAMLLHVVVPELGETVTESDLIFSLWTVRAIADLAANTPNNQTKLGTFGACEAIANVLKQLVHQGEAGLGDKLLSDLAKWTMWAIGNVIQIGRGPSTLALEDDLGNAPKKSSTALGLFEESFLNIGSVASTNSGAAGSAKKSSSFQIRNTARLNAAGVPALLLQVVHLFRKDANVAQWGSRAITNIVKSRSLRQKFSELAVADTLQELSVNFASNNEVLSWVKQAQDAFTTDDAQAPVTPTPPHH